MSVPACLICEGRVAPDEQRPRPICARCRAAGWTEAPSAVGLLEALRRTVARFVKRPSE